MFSYPLSPISFACDNLVTDDSGLASAMSVQLSVGTREEEQIVIGDGNVVAAFRDVRPRIVGHHHTRFIIGPGCRLKPWADSAAFS
jgi:hypothetical protein